MKGMQISDRVGDGAELEDMGALRKQRAVSEDI